MSLQELEEKQEVAGFIAKTFEILNNEEFGKIICWTSSGKEFLIKDNQKLQTVVLLRYFRHNRINSFIRQLNMYGFHKSRKDTLKSIFSHPLFIKGREDLLHSIKRKAKNPRNQNEDEETPIKHKAAPPSITPSTTKQTPVLSRQHSSFRLVNASDGVMPSSFRYLIDNQEGALSRLNINFSLNKVSQNDLIQSVRRKDEDCVSIEEDIAESQLRWKEIQEVASVLRFQNPTVFFNQDL